MNQFIVLLALCSAGDVKQSGDPGVVKRLREEYPPAARRLIGDLQNVELKIRRRRHWMSGKENHFIERLTRKGYSILRDASIDPDSKTPTWRVLCRTRSKMFNLTKAEASGPFILVSQEVCDPSSDESFMLGIYVEPFVDCATSIAGNTLVDLLAAPTFEVKNAREVNEGGHQVVVFEFSGTITSANHQLDAEGTVKLDPGIGWPITMLDVKARPRVLAGMVPGLESMSMFSRSEMTYKTDGGKPSLKTYHERFSSSIKRSYQEDQVEVLESKYGSVTDDQFTLQAFGLPEVPLRPRPASGFFSWKSPALWISLSLCVITFGSLVLFRSRSRERPV